RRSVRVHLETRLLGSLTSPKTIASAGQGCWEAGGDSRSRGARGSRFARVFADWVGGARQGDFSLTPRGRQGRVGVCCILSDSGRPAVSFHTESLCQLR